MVVGHKKVNVLNLTLEPFTEAEFLRGGGEKIQGAAEERWKQVN